MGREFKTTQIGELYYLYPIPVIKNQKYLILCSGINQSIELMKLIKNAEIQHPDNNLDYFEQVGTHTDNRTPVLQYVHK